MPTGADPGSHADIVGFTSAICLIVGVWSTILIADQYSEYDEGGKYILCSVNPHLRRWWVGNAVLGLTGFALGIPTYVYNKQTQAESSESKKRGLLAAGFLFWCNFFVLLFVLFIWGHIIRYGDYTGDYERDGVKIAEVEFVTEGDDEVVRRQPILLSTPQDEGNPPSLSPTADAASPLEETTTLVSDGDPRTYWYEKTLPAVLPLSPTTPFNAYRFQVSTEGPVVGRWNPAHWTLEAVSAASAPVVLHAYDGHNVAPRERLPKSLGYVGRHSPYFALHCGLINGSTVCPPAPQVEYYLNVTAAGDDIDTCGNLLRHLTYILILDYVLYTISLLLCVTPFFTHVIR